MRLKSAGSERVYRFVPKNVRSVIVILFIYLRLEFISNSDFTDSEFNFWKKQMEEKFNTFPTTEHIELKTKHIKIALNYQFAEKDIDVILREKERFKKTPHNFAMKKTELLKERDLARENDDSEKVEEVSSIFHLFLFARIDKLFIRSNGNWKNWKLEQRRLIV